MKIRLDGKKRRDAIKNVNRVFLISIILFFLTGIIFGAVANQCEINQRTTAILVECITYASLVTPFLMFAEMKKNGSEDIMFPCFDFKTLKNGFICAVIAYPTMMIAVTMANSANISSELTSDALATTVTSTHFLENVIRMAIVPAMVEEFIFRGCLLGVYMKRHVFCGIAFSAVLFALMHGNLYQIPYAIVGGLFFAGATFFTNNVGTAMVAHFFVNFTSICTAYLSEFLENNYPDQVANIEGIVTGLFMAAGVVTAVLVIRKFIKNRKTTKFTFKIKDPDLGIDDFFTGSIFAACSIFIAAICLFENVPI